MPSIHTLPMLDEGYCGFPRIPCAPAFWTLCVIPAPERAAPGAVPADSSFFALGLWFFFSQRRLLPSTCLETNLHALNSFLCSLYLPTLYSLFRHGRTGRTRLWFRLNLLCWRYPTCVCFMLACFVPADLLYSRFSSAAGQHAFTGLVLSACCWTPCAVAHSPLP